MKKETLLISAIALFILAYVIDSISGPVSITLKSPFQFLSQVNISKFPLTMVGIICRSLGIFISTILFWSLFEKIYIVKSVVTLLLSALMELFAIQQIATGMRTVTLQWTLSLSYSGLILLLLVLVYFVFHFISPVIHSEVSNNNEQNSTT